MTFLAKTPTYGGISQRPTSKTFRPTYSSNISCCPSLTTCADSAREWTSTPTTTCTKIIDLQCAEAVCSRQTLFAAYVSSKRFDVSSFLFTTYPSLLTTHNTWTF